MAGRCVNSLVVAARAVFAWGLVSVALHANGTAMAPVHSQPPAPGPTKATQPQQSHAGEPAQNASAPKDDAKKPPLPVTVDGPITIEKSQKDREAEADDSEHKSSNERWLIVWTAVLALVTLSLAGITGVLARYTYKLWDDASKASQRQAGEVRRSLVIARQTAKAAENSAAAAIKQVKAAVNVERPFLYISEIRVTRTDHSMGGMYPETYDVALWFTNYGRTPAFISRMGFGYAIVQEAPAEPSYATSVLFDKEFVVKPNEKQEIHVRNAVVRIEVAQRAEINKDRVFPWLWGYVAYRDFFYGMTESGFIAKHVRHRNVGGATGFAGEFRFDGPTAYTYQRYKESEA